MPSQSAMSVFGLLLIIPAAIAGLAAIAAPFGTTILGFVAIGQIRRSAGRLYGLPLAVFDALLFPLLLLDGIILVAIAGVTMAILTLSGLRNRELWEVLPEAITLAISLPIIAWVDYRIVRAVWRNATGLEPPPKPIVAAAVSGQGGEPGSAGR